MFGYVKQSKFDELVAELARERENHRNTMRHLGDAWKERDALKARLRTGNGNLRQFRQPQVLTDVAGNPCT